eukprot:UN01853
MLKQKALKQNKAPKKVAKKVAKKVSPKKIAKRNYKPSTLGIGTPTVADTVERDPTLAFTVEDGEVKFARVKHKFDDLSAEEFNKLGPGPDASEETLAKWEAEVSDPKNFTVQALERKQVAEDNLVHEFGATETNHYGPAAVQYNIFNRDSEFPVTKRIIGVPGTMEEPTMVFSPKPYRIVGCVGTVEAPHPLGWFSMEGYLKHMCPNCGQIFQLTNDPEQQEDKYLEPRDNMAHFLGH